MSHEAYQKAANASPRDAEYRAFSEATKRLLEVADIGRRDLRTLIGAIHANRQLWAALARDCADDANALPTETRARIISLSRWVDAYSSDIMRKQESIEPLIDVNKIIMAGLSPTITAAADA